LIPAGIVELSDGSRCAVIKVTSSNHTYFNDMALPKLLKSVDKHGHTGKTRSGTDRHRALLPRAVSEGRDRPLSRLPRIFPRQAKIDAAGFSGSLLIPDAPAHASLRNVRELPATNAVRDPVLSRRGPGAARPRLLHPSSSTQTIRFSARHWDRRIRCGVTRTALEDRAGALQPLRPADLERVFEQ